MAFICYIRELLFQFLICEELPVIFHFPKFFSFILYFTQIQKNCCLLLRGPISITFTIFSLFSLSIAIVLYFTRKDVSLTSVIDSWNTNCKRPTQSGHGYSRLHVYVHCYLILRFCILPCDLCFPSIHLFSSIFVSSQEEKIGMYLLTLLSLCIFVPVLNKASKISVLVN